MSGKANSLKTIFLALGANFAIFVAKFVAAIATGSGSMLAEAVHSLADCGNQCLLLIGLNKARQPPSPAYPLGHGAAIYFWSFLVAVLLFSIGGMFSIYEGIHKLGHAEPIAMPWLALTVLGFSIVAESLSMWGCLREVNKVRNGRSLWRWFRESRSSELIVVFGEDLAALLGLAVAFVAVLITLITGDPVYDACGSIAIGALLIVIAVFVAIEVAALLIGQSAEPDVVAAIDAFVAAQPGVLRVFSLITLQLGNDIMVSIKAEMAGDLSALAMIREINRIEAELRQRFPQIRWSFFEPDIQD